MKKIALMLMVTIMIVSMSTATFADSSDSDHSHSISPTANHIHNWVQQFITREGIVVSNYRCTRCGILMNDKWTT